MSQTRRWTKAIGAALLLVLAGGLLLAACGGDGSSGEGADHPATTAAGTGSAAGKPCVAVADPLPAGAPEVPLKTGEPPTELVTEDLVTGAGATVAPGATVTVDYVGVACSTGTVFDSSYQRGEPATFPLDQMIAGWSQGLVGMQVGGRRLLGIPPGLAYGDRGAPPDIAPGETLWFVVDVKDVQPA